MQDAPKTDESGQHREDEKENQEETGEAGQQTDETVGVGQSQAPLPPDQDMHKGDESAITTDTQQQQNVQEQRQQKKPGEVNEDKITGDPEKDLKKGLLTNKKKDLAKEQPEDNADMKDNNDNEDKEESKDSALYQVCIFFKWDFDWNVIAWFNQCYYFFKIQIFKIAIISHYLFV